MSERKKTPVNILVKTQVTQENEFKEFLVDIKGQAVTVGEVLYLRYEESLEGLEKTTPVTIKLLPTGEVTLIRTGEVKMTLHFAYEKRKESSYATPYGMMTIATYTKEMLIRKDDSESSGNIEINYDLYAGEEKLGEYQLEIRFGV